MSANLAFNSKVAELLANKGVASVKSPETTENLPPEFEAALTPLRDTSKYDPLEFIDAIELLSYFDDNIRSGRRKLHSWQVKVQKFLARNDYTIANPLRFFLCAANGSGKDAYIISPFAVFLILTKIRTRVIITSSSYSQLQSQTENYIRSLAYSVNSKLQEQGICSSGPLLIKKEHIVNTLTGSEIKMFVTDDPGRAEGYHPFPDYPESELCIIVNEAKTVTKPIFEALSRCTYNRWIEVSTPGGASGHFHDRFMGAKDLREISGEYNGSLDYCYRVSSYDCEHISRVKIEKDKEEMGENSILFRSKHLALFTSLDDSVVLNEDLIYKCRTNWKDKKNKEIRLGTLRVGGDLAGAGSNENSCYAFDGNVRVHEEHWNETDTTKTAERFCRIFRHLKSLGYDLQPEDICLDDGGIGHAIIDMIAKEGWEVSRVRNQSQAIWTKQFGNRGAELWFNIKRLAEEGYILLDDEKDELLIKQLASRHYRKSEDLGKLFLESKKEAIAKGRPSPDRADAFVLAFARVRPSTFIEVKNPVIKAKVAMPTQNELVREMNTDQMGILAQELRREMEFVAKEVKYNNCHPSNILRNLYD